MTAPSQRRLLRNCQLADGRLVHIEVSADGLIAQVTSAGAEDRSGPNPAPTDRETVTEDLNRWLVLPAPAEPHAHLDKALRADLAPNPTGDLTGAIDAWVSVGREGPLTPGRFDLVVSSTAFHWIPQPAGFRGCRELLRPGGHLALWWNFFGDLDRPDPFHEAIQPLMVAAAPELLRNNVSAGAHPYALDIAARTADIDASGWFGPVIHDRIHWTGRHSPREIRDMFGSFSPWLALAPSVREPLLDQLVFLAEGRFGGVVERPYSTAVYTASCVGAVPPEDQL